MISSAPEYPWRKSLPSSQRVMRAMLQMDKIDIGGLKRAYAAE